MVKPRRFELIPRKIPTRKIRRKRILSHKEEDELRLLEYIESDVPHILKLEDRMKLKYLREKRRKKLELKNL